MFILLEIAYFRFCKISAYKQFIGIHEQANQRHSFVAGTFAICQIPEVGRKMVSLDWSASRRNKPNEVQIKNQPHLFVKACQLHDLNRQVFVFRANKKMELLLANISKSTRMNLSKLLVCLLIRLFSPLKNLKRSFQSEFVFIVSLFKSVFQVYVISKVGHTFSCTCPVGAKRHPCRHSIFIACKLGI